MLLFGVNQHNSDDPLRNALSLDTPTDIDAICSEAQENNLKLQETDKKYFDKRHKTPHEYKAGDLVVIKNVDVTPDVSKKLLMKFGGPYQVKKYLEMTVI
jgi:hypothetical protein